MLYDIAKLYYMILATSIYPQSSRRKIAEWVFNGENFFIKKY